MELMKSLTFQKEDEWLKELYAMKFMKVMYISKYEISLLIYFAVQTTTGTGSSSETRSTEITTY